MITQRKTIIPIFNYKLTIVIFDRWEELEGSIPQDEMDTEANAITSWFGDNVDQKIIESAIIFWFKDVDCKSRNKVVSYFKEY